MNDEQLTQRLKAASEAIEISDDAQGRHLEAISAALSAGDVIPLSAARSTRRRQVIASIVAAAVIVPAGLAAASEDAVPGDTLYGIKQLSERVLVLFDSDIIARHRVEEIEALEDSGRTEPALYDDAREALTELGEDHPLWERLSTSPATLADEDAGEPDPVDDDYRSDTEEVPIAPLRLVLDLPDGTEATIIVEAGRIVDITTPAGWDVSEKEDNEATLESRSYEVEIDLQPEGALRAEVTARADTDDDPSADDGGLADSDIDEPDEPDDDETGSTSPEDDPEGDSSDDTEDGAEADSSEDSEDDSDSTDDDGDSSGDDPEDDS